MWTGQLSHYDVFRYGVLAGTAGGLAEVIWVCVYSLMTGGDAAALARGVTTAAGVNALLQSAPIATGVLVHMGLAVILGIALTAFWSRLGTQSLRSGSLAILAAVWAVNFFVVLPIVSPAFIDLVPHWVSLTSKLLFGLAAAETLRLCMARPLPAVA